FFFPKKKKKKKKKKRLRYQMEHELLQRYPMLGANAISQLSNMRLRASSKQEEIVSGFNRQLTLERVLMSKSGLELFAAHLVKELSLENILYLIEYMQLKHFISIHQSHLLQYNDVRAVGFRVEICSSLIVENLHPCLLRVNIPISSAWQICLNMFAYLYSHYILDTSVACLNISFDSTASIQRAMSQLHQYPSLDMLPSLITAFDAATIDVLHLLRGDSFLRFQKSPEGLTYSKDFV
ncbi:hypothetical protein RFI_17358, partial [Reticulomyxa filosa]